jgi:phospholipid transport system substrate-binding protein
MIMNARLSGAMVALLAPIMLSLSLAVFGAAIPVVAHAGIAADPQAEMEATARQLFAAIDQNRVAIRKDPKKANPLVETILLPHFDTEYSAQLVLAQHWRSASPEQRQRFVNAMVQMLMNTYAGALTEFSSDKFKILPYRADNNPDMATVRTQVMRSSGVVVPVDYKLRRTPSGWKAFDVVIEGISYVKNYRTDLGAEISQRGLDAVIARIEKDGLPAASSKP